MQTLYSHIYRRNWLTRLREHGDNLDAALVPVLHPVLPRHALLVAAAPVQLARSPEHPVVVFVRQLQHAGLDSGAEGRDPI